MSSYPGLAQINNNSNDTSTNNNRIIIAFDPTDPVTTNVANEISHFSLKITNVKMIPIYSHYELLRLINSINNPTVYVFHGNKIGWKIGSDFVENSVLITAIQNSKAYAHFLAVCNSNYIASQITNKYMKYLVGDVDSVIVSYYMKNMLLDYFANNGLDITIQNQLHDYLINFANKNSQLLISRFFYPQQTLSPCYSSVNPPKSLSLSSSSIRVNSACYQIIIRYDSSYIGPSGLYNVQKSTTLSNPSSASNNDPVTINYLQTLVNAMNFIPGIKINLVVNKISISGNSVYTYYIKTYPDPYTSITTYYSISNPVSFNIYELTLTAEIDPKAIKQFLNNGDSASMSYQEAGLSFSYSADLTPDPIPTYSGKVDYITPEFYTQSASNSNCINVVKNYISQNYPAGWKSVDLYATLGYNEDIHFTVVIPNYGTVYVDGQLFAGGRVEFYKDSSGYTRVTESFYAFGSFSSSGLSFTINIKGVIAIGVLQEDFTDNYQNLVINAYNGQAFGVSVSSTTFGGDFIFYQGDTLYSSNNANPNDLMLGFFLQIIS